MAILDGIAPLIQIDLADGVLVEGKTYLDLEKILETVKKSQVELHFMVEDPLKYLEALQTMPGKDKVRKVSTQIVKDSPSEVLSSFLTKSKNMDLEEGLSLNPETPLTLLQPYIKNLNFIQFVAVTPGKQGGILQPETIEKITQARRLFPNTTLQVDGGIKKENIMEVLQAGVDNVVIGSGIFGERDPVSAYKEFVSIEKSYRNSANQD
ncbi:MAG TPA: hypothetical protein ENN92_01065 [candidate division WWE3 bacterium]|uniref:Ribulose-phosphate 3-epimerase n=1 Tax=candidate division WWE3 bacterium TaxID=2053526 RepID=A0A7C1HYW2_UNCKA|nr:hypothetical protein [candidate division WWE3 bacterium]